MNNHIINHQYKMMIFKKIILKIFLLLINGKHRAVWCNFRLPLRRRIDSGGHYIKRAYNPWLHALVLACMCATNELQSNQNIKTRNKLCLYTRVPTNQYPGRVLQLHLHTVYGVICLAGDSPSSNRTLGNQITRSDRASRRLSPPTAKSKVDLSFCIE